MILDSLAFCHSEILSNFFIVAMFIELFIFIVYLLELKNSDNFRHRRRRDLSNLPPATTGYRRDPGRRQPSPVSLAFTGATGIHWLHQHSPAPPHSYGTIY